MYATPSTGHLSQGEHDRRMRLPERRHSASLQCVYSAIHVRLLCSLLAHFYRIYRDVSGAVGFPVQQARTIVVGRNAELINKLLFILTYFVRCSEVADDLISISDLIKAGLLSGECFLIAKALSEHTLQVPQANPSVWPALKILFRQCKESAVDDHRRARTNQRRQLCQNMQVCNRWCRMLHLTPRNVAFAQCDRARTVAQSRCCKEVVDA